MHAGRSHVIDIKEFATRRARAPDGDTGCAGKLGLVESPQHGRNHVAVLRVIVVPRAIQVGGHHAAVVGAVLAVVAFAKLDAGDLCNRIRFVGRLERAREQCIFGHRLRRQLGVDAA